jgi:L-asparaginase
VFHGVNDEILGRLDRVDALEPLTRAELAEALGSPDNYTRSHRVSVLIEKLWRSDVGLGAPPVTDVASRDLDDHYFATDNDGYVVHWLQVYLLGLDVFFGQPKLRKVLEEGRDTSRFLRRWKIAALAHGHGYSSTVKGRVPVPATLRRLLEDPLSTFDAHLRAATRSRLAELSDTRARPAQFFDELDMYEGASLEKGVIGQAGPVVSDPSGDPRDIYLQLVNVQRPADREWRLLSALVLLDTHRRLLAQLKAIPWDRVPDDLLTRRERGFLRNAELRMTDAVEDIHAACGAIVLEDLRRGIWTSKLREIGGVQSDIPLGDYRIGLAESPLAWLLTFCDTLQSWDWQGAFADSVRSSRYLSGALVELQHADGRIWIRFLDEQEHLLNTGQSRHYALRLNLVNRLDEGSVDSFLSYGSPTVGWADDVRDGLASDSLGDQSMYAPGVGRRQRNWQPLGKIDPDSDADRVLSDVDAARQVYKDTLPVCVLYTGGAIGMVPSDAYDPASVLVSRPVSYIIPYLGRILELPFDVHFWETTTPMDSSNVGPEHWSGLARMIQILYSRYQGFVVLHGTDTMAFTASALSFLFRNLDKPIILTGSERPIGQLVTDAVPNVMNALQIAAPFALGIPVVPEVCIYFGGKLMRGNRAKKTHSLSVVGFDSPNSELLGIVDEKIRIDASVIRHGPVVPRHDYAHGKELDLTVEKLESRVAVYELYPSMNPCLDILEYALIKSPEVRAVVLKTYGTGNVPTLPARFLELIEAGVGTYGKVVVSVTSCPAGQVEVRLFEVGARLYELGVISGADMTVEAAMTKLMWLFAHHRLPGDTVDREAVIRDFQIDLRGELRFSVHSLRQKHIDLVGAAYVSRPRYIGEIDPAEVNHAYLRIQGVRVLSSVPQDVTIRFYLQSPTVTVENSPRWLPRMIGEVTRRWESSESHRRVGLTFNVDATQVVRSQLLPKDSLSLQIVPVSGTHVRIESVELLIFTEQRSRRP